MKAKLFLFLAEKYGLFVLAGLTAAAFLLACFEAYGTAEPNLMGLWKAVASTVNSDASDTKGAAQAMHVLATATIGWGATRVYMATAGFKWDTISARYLARNHVVIIAGRSVAREASGSSIASRSHGASAVNKSGLAVELAL